ncbi:hypothetical protein [Streptomyces sp. RK9]
MNDRTRHLTRRDDGDRHARRSPGGTAPAGTPAGRLEGVRP